MHKDSLGHLSLARQTSSTIDKHLFLDISRPILIGLSGGADSVALLHVMHNLGYKCIALHCNFHLRGQESERDHSFARAFAQSLNVEFFDIHFDTEEFANKNNLSIEMACRQLRYDWFAQMIEQKGAQAIAVGHHQDDTIETFFINLMRGSGITGLSGIKYVNGHVVRPFLDSSREQIEQYLNDHSIDFIVDSTNLEDIYLRNKVRLNLIPLLEEINPSAKKTILRSMDNLRQVESIYNKAIEEEKNNLMSISEKEVRVNIKQLLNSENPNTLLFEILKDYGVSRTQIEPIMKSFDSISGKRFDSASHQIIKDREYIIITPLCLNIDQEYLIESNTISLEEPLKLEISRIDHSPTSSLKFSPEIAYLDLSKISFPLTIRRWRQGDKFKPLGMKGYKKLSDFFSNNKFSLIEKQNTWILESAGQIVWVMGHRLDDRFKVTEQTNNIVQIKIM